MYTQALDNFDQQTKALKRQIFSKTQCILQVVLHYHITVKRFCFPTHVQQSVLLLHTRCKQIIIVNEIHPTLPHDHVQYLKYIATLASCPTFPVGMLWQKTVDILILSENFGTKRRQSPTKRQSHMYINLHDMTDLIYGRFWRIRLKILLIAREF